MLPTEQQAAQKRIRSFMRRQGRITQAQRQALVLYHERYCLDYNVNYDFEQVFGRNAPIIFEIGFGNGDSLAQMAMENRDLDYIGIEVHRPGVGHLMMKLESLGITNVRIFCHDAIEILQHKIRDNSLAGIQLYFPDPWPKRKHHKRRIFRPGFVHLAVTKLKPGGYFHAATDWQQYAESMLADLSSAPGIHNTSQTNDYCSRPHYRPMTKFEQRGISLGHSIRDLIFCKEFS